VKPRIHRNDGGWCCCNSGWIKEEERYVGVAAEWGPTPITAYVKWRRAFAEMICRRNVEKRRQHADFPMPR
jgi:hypothetical protein